MKYLILLFFSILFLSCSDEMITSSTSAEGAAEGVISKKMYTPDLKLILRIEDYEYNKRKKIAMKVNYAGNREIKLSYETFFYDNNDRLTAKAKYSNNINSPGGFIKSDSTLYSYNGDFLVSQKILYPQTHGGIDEIKYEYDGKLLKTESYYYNFRYSKKVVYEYNWGRIQRKVAYDNAGNIFQIVQYTHDGNYLKETREYAPNNELVSRTKYDYSNGKLAKETYETLALYLSSTPYVILYEY